MKRTLRTGLTIQVLMQIWLMHNWSGVYEGKYKRSKEDRRGCGTFQPMLQVRRWIR